MVKKGRAGRGDGWSSLSDSVISRETFCGIKGELCGFCPLCCRRCRDIKGDWQVKNGCGRQLRQDRGRRAWQRVFWTNRLSFGWGFVQITAFFGQSALGLTGVCPNYPLFWTKTIESDQSLSKLPPFFGQQPLNLTKDCPSSRSFWTNLPSNLPGVSRMNPRFKQSRRESANVIRIGPLIITASPVPIDSRPVPYAVPSKPDRLPKTPPPSETSLHPNPSHPPSI